MKRMNQQKSKLHVNFKYSFHVKTCYVKQRFCLANLHLNSKGPDVERMFKKTEYINSHKSL